MDSVPVSKEKFEGILAEELEALRPEQSQPPTPTPTPTPTVSKPKKIGHNKKEQANSILVLDISLIGYS